MRLRLYYQTIRGNWWHWFIGMPQNLCNTVILMYDDRPPELTEREARTLENFNEDPNKRYHTASSSEIKNTAAKLIDASLVSALRSSISETSRPLNLAKEALAYTGGYGSTLLVGKCHF